MWVVLKYKNNELNFLKGDLKKKLGQQPKIYQPKIKLQRLIKNKIKFIERNLLEDYIFCYHEKFCDKKLILLLNNSRGLKYFLRNCHTNQNEIINFIKSCKKNENNDGYIKQEFFNFKNFKKGIFIDGPFANLIFNVIQNQSKRIKALIGNVKITIRNDSSFLYRPV